MVFSTVESLPPNFAIADLPPMVAPRGLLMCAPRFFDVVDVKNPFMEGSAGTVDRAAALAQWDALRAAIVHAGTHVSDLTPLEGCEDMVFCANPAFLGLDALGAKVCAPSRMSFPSRRPEVAAIVEWCSAAGYRIADLGDPTLRFEGGGDALWHPGRHLIWGGYGWRSDAAIYPAVASAFGAPVIQLRLVLPEYYHLDTCLCLIDERTALVHAPAFADEGLRLIRRLVDRVVDVDAAEASAFACNATALPNGAVVLDRRAQATAAKLRALGFDVIEVETGEFLKSGGSVYCMKNSYY